LAPGILISESLLGVILTWPTPDVRWNPQEADIPSRAIVVEQDSDVIVGQAIIQSQSVRSSILEPRRGTNLLQIGPDNADRVEFRDGVDVDGFDHDREGSDHSGKVYRPSRRDGRDLDAGLTIVGRCSPWGNKDLPRRRPWHPVKGWDTDPFL
jgi:hypothetical protein